MGDLVRFWYGALFLFASAYTLFDDGHVRVDVLYSGFRDRAKGKVNSIGAILLGIIFCWVVIILGMENKSSIINAPLIGLEVTQNGFGMFVKYLMAGFLGVFAVSMMIAFCAQLLEGVPTGAAIRARGCTSTTTNCPATDGRRGRIRWNCCFLFFCW